MKRYALFSLSDKVGSRIFAKQLIKRGFTILSSGGTATYLREGDIDVTDASKFTGFPPVLGHRVVTLAPQIHGGLLATPDMKEELESLKWPWIDLVYVNFYPLQEELGKAGSTFESCIEKTDIGGPTVIRSANKGGRIVLVSKDQIPEVLDWVDAGEKDRDSFVRRWSGIAEGVVANYVCASAEVYEKFGCI